MPMLRQDRQRRLRKRLAKLLSRRTKAMGDGIQLSVSITGAILRHACGLGARQIAVGERPDAGMAEDEEPGFSAAVSRQYVVGCLIPAFDGAIFSVEWKDALFVLDTSLNT